MTTLYPFLVSVCTLYVSSSVWPPMAPSQRSCKTIGGRGRDCHPSLSTLLLHRYLFNCSFVCYRKFLYDTVSRTIQRVLHFTPWQTCSFQCQLLWEAFSHAKIAALFIHIILYTIPRSKYTGNYLLSILP